MVDEAEFPVCGRSYRCNFQQQTVPSSDPAACVRERTSSRPVVDLGLDPRWQRRDVYVPAR